MQNMKMFWNYPILWSGENDSNHFSVHGSALRIIFLSWFVIRDSNHSFHRNLWFESFLPWFALISPWGRFLRRLPPILLTTTILMRPVFSQNHLRSVSWFRVSFCSFQRFHSAVLKAITKQLFWVSENWHFFNWKLKFQNRRKDRKRKNLRHF